MVTTQDTAVRARKPNGRVNRGDRARFLFERGHVHIIRGGYAYEVTSETQPDVRYRVVIMRRDSTEVHACSCPDYRRAVDQYRNPEHQCKHIGAVILHRAACRSGFRAHIPAVA